MEAVASTPIKGSPWIILVAVMASLLEIIDTSIVNVALPTMMGNLGATLDEISMVITGYAIANAVVLPLSAWLGERIGRRKYYLGCILVFTLTSVACGLAPNLYSLIVFRILQGLAGGALLPTSQTLIYEQFPKEKAGIAGAIFGMSVMIGPTLGPVMGGYLTDNFGWRSIFNINLPLGILTLFIGMTFITNREGHNKELMSKAFDYIGLTLLIVGIGCLQYVFERGEAQDWFNSKTIIFCTVAAILALPSFVWWESKTANPVINVRLFKNPTVSNGVMLMGLLGFFLYALIFVLPVFVNSVFHYTATQTGELFIPGSILTAMMMPFVGQAMMKGISAKKLIFIGITSIIVCQYMLANLSPMSSNWDILMPLFVRGFAMAFLFVPINSGILSQFQGINLGQVSGLLNLFRQIGGSMGIALVATLLASRGHQNYADVSSKVSLLNSSTQSEYYAAKASLQAKPVKQLGMVKNDQVVLKVFRDRINQQVFMLSFQQMIWIILFIFSLAYIPLYFLRLGSKTLVKGMGH